MKTTNVNESKQFIKKLLRENIEQNQKIQQQVQAELEKLGLPSDTQVYFNGDIISCNRENVNEDLKNFARNAIVVCSLVAGVVSCQKAKHEFQYKYVYDDSQSIQYNKEKGTNIRNTCIAVYDHILSSNEVKQEQSKLKEKYLNDPYKKITPMNDTLVPIDASVPYNPNLNK